MGVPAREAAPNRIEDTMNTQKTTRRHTWHSLTRTEKQARLQGLRRQQAHAIEFDLRRLHQLR
jgi:hypothetical protein